MISSRRFRNSGRISSFLIHQHTDGCTELGKVIGELKAETTAAFLNYPRTNVGGHDQQRVLKSTVRPLASVRRPSSKICSSILNTSGWAFRFRQTAPLYGACAGRLRSADHLHTHVTGGEPISLETVWRSMNSDIQSDHRFQNQSKQPTFVVLSFHQWDRKR